MKQISVPAAGALAGALYRCTLDPLGAWGWVADLAKTFTLHIYAHIQQELYTCMCVHI